MNHYLLHFTLGGPYVDLPWQSSLLDKKVSTLRAQSLREALQYCKVYHPLMVLLEPGAARQESGANQAESTGESVRQAVEALTSQANSAHLPVIALVGSVPSETERRELAQAGLVDWLSRDDPAPFFLWRVEMLEALSDLRAFEKERMDVARLAGNTRTHLHDLSQPLSAVQGRLQLLASRCPADDPNASTFQELVRLILEVSRGVMEIHQIHRRYS